jgi:hypothetical protein
MDSKEWVDIRETKNYQDDHGVTDVSSSDLRCFQYKAGTSSATVAAGDSIGFVADQTVDHPGPVQFYMAAVPNGQDVNTWEATGNVWFKVGSIGAVSNGNSLSWPTYSMSFSQLPLDTPMSTLYHESDSL